MSEQTRYSRVVPNSHSFMSLSNLFVSYEYQPDELTLDYLITGFENTLEREMDLCFNVDEMGEAPPSFYFTSITDILTHLNIQVEFDVKDFMVLINSTMRNGFDLKDKNSKDMEKKEVYNRVDGELDYQQLRWVVRRDANGTPDETKPPAEWLIYMDEHMRQAKEAIYHLEDEEVMAQIRKVVALGVRALMIHGCPEREIPEELKK